MEPKSIALSVDRTTGSVFTLMQIKRIYLHDFCILIFHCGIKMSYEVRA